MTGLRIGQRVRARAGMYAGTVGTVTAISPGAPGPWATVQSGNESFSAFLSALEVVDEGPQDIPRTAVVDLLAAVEKRVAELDDAVCSHWPSADAVDACASELHRIATALRKLLGGES